MMFRWQIKLQDFRRTYSASASLLTLSFLLVKACDAFIVSYNNVFTSLEPISKSSLLRTYVGPLKFSQKGSPNKFCNEVCITSLSPSCL